MGKVKRLPEELYVAVKPQDLEMKRGGNMAKNINISELEADFAATFAGLLKSRQQLEAEFEAKGNEAAQWERIDLKGKVMDRKALPTVECRWIARPVTIEFRAGSTVVTHKVYTTHVAPNKEGILSVFGIRRPLDADNDEAKKLPYLHRQYRLDNIISMTVGEQYELLDMLEVGTIHMFPAQLSTRRAGFQRHATPEGALMAEKRGYMGLYPAAKTFQA